MNKGGKGTGPLNAALLLGERCKETGYFIGPLVPWSLLFLYLE